MAEDGIGAVVFRSDEKATYVRNALGQFTTFQRQMRQAHERMAANVAHHIQYALQTRIEETGRPQVARTHAGQGADLLVNTIIEPGNRTAGYGGFTVMDLDYLSRSIVNEYYRGLETGSDRFVGRQFTGFFVEPGASKASRERTRSQGVLIVRGPGGVLPGQAAAEQPSRLVGKEGQGFGGGAYGTRRGESTTNVIPAVSLFGPLDARDGRAGTGGLITIENPIPAYHYIETGFADWIASDDDMVQTQVAAQQAGLRMEGRRVIPPSV